MKNKMIMWIVLLLFVVSFAFVGCGQDGEGELVGETNVGGDNSEDSSQQVANGENDDLIIEVLDSIDYSSLLLGESIVFDYDSGGDIIEFGSSNEDIVQIIDDGLEVVGVGSGDLTIFNKTTETEIYSTRFNVYNSIVVTAIKEELKALNYITSNSETLTPELLSKVETLDLDGQLINNISDVVSIKTLTGLKQLNIANNDIEDSSFLSTLLDLEELNISNNLISSIASISYLTNLVKLDVSFNNIDNISDFTYLSRLQELNIGSNDITNIRSLSALYDLTALDMSYNAISSDTIDAISGLSELVSLNVAYTSISSTTIQSLSYIGKITSLDLSGLTASISDYTNKLLNVEELSLNDCSLSSNDIVALGLFKNLETLNVEGNSFMYSDVVKLVDSLSTYNNIQNLNIGRNLFSDIPDFSSLTKLKALNLSDLKNLYSVSQLSTASSVETVYLDRCIAISSENTLQEELGKMPNLQEFSFVEGFYYLDRTTFDYIENLVQSGDLKIRIFEDEWVDSTTVTNYTETVYFSAEELLEDMTADGESYLYNYQGQTSRLIISFINEDTSNFIFKDSAIIFNSDVFQVDLYGRSSKKFDMKIQVNNRNSSDIFINLYDFKISVDSGYALEAFADSSVVIGGRGESSLISTADIAIVCDDIEFSYGVEDGDILNIQGGQGLTGETGASTDSSNTSGRKGCTGGTGYTAVYCSNAVVSTQYILIKGGTGGIGGKGGASLAEWATLINSFKYGGDGGIGGIGGTGIQYSESYFILYSSTVQGGDGGAGGAGGSGYCGYSSWDGSTGDQGSTGAATSKII